ncbi:MAG: ATP-binding protein [Candidatus Poribacteria bacterium]|nr:ATP-binding protein [Candidatus Poribacteria bacterium]
MDAPKKYQMTINLNVLNHLGINLYSNIPAVLSEVVANSWDADAKNVDIEIGTERITITDDGHGMTYEDINDKYLKVGYERRTHEAVKTEKFDREVMGRKGIGKLSLFSIAKIVKVESMKDSSHNGFVMSTDEIEKHIKEDKPGPYEPTPMPDSEMVLNKRGTRITLTDLKKRVTIAHPEYVKKRLARRFSIIGAENNFKVCVDGTPISITDRDYFHKLQYLWHYGDESEKYVDLCNKSDNFEHEEKRDGSIQYERNTQAETYPVRGWIGTVTTPSALTDKDVNENLNKIVIMVRGKLAQEDILEDIREAGFYNKYLIGEIHADFLDDDDLLDIATSNRQEIMKDDQRYISLRNWIKSELSHIRVTWDDLRTLQVNEEAQQIPAIKEWLHELPPPKRQQAKVVIDKIAGLDIDEPKDRIVIYKHTALAFENLLYKQSLDKLDKISIETLPTFLEIIGNFDDFEATLYYQIIQERLEIISALRDKVEDNSVEKTIQKLLYEHLWLLDPSWDRATETPHMEQSVKKEFEDIDAKEILTDPELNGRYDIKYKMTAGKHVIIELKRADRVLNHNDLLKQVEKYGNALRKLIRETGKNEPIEIVCLVGRDLEQWSDAEERERSKRTMAEQNVRVILYKELIEDAYRNYNAFLQLRHEYGRVYRLIKNLEIEVPEVD